MAAILAAAMSNLSAALNALSSTTVIDFLRPIFSKGGMSKGEGGEQVWLKWARYATAVWAAILFGVALLARNWGSVLQTGLSIASVLYGALLGVFLLGVLTRRVGEKAAMIGMSAGFAVMIYVRFGTPIAFTWYVLIGTAATFGVGWAASLVISERIRNDSGIAIEN